MVGSDSVDAVLRLGVGSHCLSSLGSGGTAAPSRIVEGPSPNTAQIHQRRQQQQQITIVFNGRICACDVTEIQARTIISLAKREMDQVQHHREKPSPPDQTPPLPSPAVATASPPQLVNPRLSMKRSLQRFLQKRKARISVASPYHQFTKESSYKH